MFDFSVVEKNLKEHGYEVKVYATLKEAAEYLDSVIDDTTVGIGGSGTVKESGLYETLKGHNKDEVWHWFEEASDAARVRAMNTEVYLTSVNAMAETGEMISIDGCGNRIASMLFGHKKIYYLVGRNKITKTYEEAQWRARNVAGPKRAQQMGRKTPCAVNADKCYDCKSPERICNGMVTLLKPMMGMAAEILLIDEDLGL